MQPNALETLNTHTYIVTYMIHIQYRVPMEWRRGGFGTCFGPQIWAPKTAASPRPFSRPTLCRAGGGLCPPGVCARSIEVIYKANFRLLGTFGLIAAAEGISKSRRARDTTLSVPLEANIHTECRIYRFSRIRSACVRTGQDRTPEANRWSPPAPAPGSESLRAVSMYLTQF